jgi:tetratricopeptide (TPR) repeat protein
VPIFLLLIAAVDLDADIESLRKRTAEIEPQVQILQSSYLQTEAFDQKTSVKQRISEGETLFLLGDHGRSSVLLFDVVSDARNSEHPDYDLALYYLAESSYLTRNIIGARRHFRELVTRTTKRGDAGHLFDAFERLIQIADSLQDYRGVEEMVGELREAGKGTLRPDVAYLYGRSLSQRGQSHFAFEQLATVPAGHKYYHRARYVMGAEYARNARFEEAVVAFEEVKNAEHPLGLGATPDEERQIRELSIMAIARVHAEQGDTEKAMEGYAAIAKDSQYLTQALYEIAWMFVGRASAIKEDDERSVLLRRALQAIDILLLSQDDQALVPRAQILKGNVLIRLGRLPDAIDAFRGVGDIYEPVYRELTETLAKQPDKERYFNEIILQNKGVYNAAAFLPPLAVSWVSAERDVSRAIGVANDLVTAQRDLEESHAITERIVGALTRKRPVDLFPLFKEGERKGTKLESEQRDLMETLLALMRQAVSSSGDADALSAVEKERAQAIAQLKTQGETRGDIGEDERKRNAALSVVAHEASKNRTELSGMGARLVAVDRFLSTKDNGLDEQGKKTLREQSNIEAKAVQAIEKEQREIEEELRRARYEGAGPVSEENHARAAYDEAVTREWALLEEGAKKASLASTGAVKRLQALADRLGSVDAGLRSFRDRLETTAERRALQIAGGVEAELQQVAIYEAQLTEVEKGAGRLIGGIASRSFEEVRQKLYELVLKADVGLIDVVWREKDDRTEMINDLVKAQKDAGAALDRDFSELFSSDKPTGRK